MPWNVMKMKKRHCCCKDESDNISFCKDARPNIACCDLLEIDTLIEKVPKNMDGGERL